MTLQTDLARQLGLELPIIQAPMAGGGDTPALVAAVAEAGGLGSIGAAYLPPTRIGETAQRVRETTNRPFAINLFAPQDLPPPPADPSAALARVAPFFAELGLAPPSLPASGGFSFDAQLEAALESGASVFSFALGRLPAPAIAAAKARGMFVMGTATTVGEARRLEADGVAAVIAQGAEAGGHRSTFEGDVQAGMIGTMALVPQIADAVSIPVVAAGGIMDGRGLAAALALGAQAVQLGTAFLATAEAGVPEAYKETLLGPDATRTRITRAFSGRPARGIENRFMRQIERTADAEAILPFPYQNALTRPLRAAAAQQGRADCLSLWAGQGAPLIQRLPAGELVLAIARAARAALSRRQ